MSNELVLPVAQADELRKVTLVGPPIGAPDPKGRRQPLWTLSAGAPHFDKDHAYENYKPIGANADNVHPLRVLVSESVDRGQVPRLVAIHLLLGATGYHHYKERQDDNDRLILHLTAAGTTIDAKTLLRTVSEPADNAAPFVHVVGEPLRSLVPNWPFPEQNAKIKADDKVIEIVVPPFRLVAGHISLETRVKGLAASPKNLAWLRDLGADDIDWCPLWLTPDGLEFDAKLPFPDVANPSVRRLSARVLMSRTDDGTLTLTSVALKKPNTWAAAWTALHPKVGPKDVLPGLNFAARRGPDLPTFRWTVVRDQYGTPTGILPDVEVRGDALRIDLVSPAVRGTIDGVATLRPTWVKMRRHTVDDLEFTFKANNIGDALTLDLGVPVKGLKGAKERVIKLTWANKNPFRLEVDSVQLAADLRTAHGIPTPTAPTDQPLLSAFVPLAGGWLQLPVPNHAPATAGAEGFLVPPPPDRSPAVFDGFFRLKNIGPNEGTLSAHDDNIHAPPTRADAPWSITIERATGIDFALHVNPTAPALVGEIVDPTKSALVSATVKLHGMTLSTRGLLWISTDRPDALEALPRLGAGPGSFIDIPLAGTLGQDTRPTPVMRADLEALTIIGEKSEWRLDLVFDTEALRWGVLLGPLAAQRALTGAHAALHADWPADKEPWPAVVWRRHSRIPLAAAMPMTRAASAAVRPLESRDLLPFVLAARPDPGHPLRKRLARLQKRPNTPLLSLVEVGLKQLTLARKWPRPNPTAGTGVPLVALGVPGMELFCDDAKQYQAAVRYDLPALDEAFATAPLPPVPGAPQPDERAAAAARPIPTALDWPGLADFWGDQERKLQNARVVDSYLAPFAPTEREATLHVDNLIAGARWTTTLETSTRNSATDLYGSLTLAGHKTAGDNALRGHSGAVTFEPPLKLELLGFSPPTFEAKPNDQIHRDNRRVGASSPTLGNELMSRPVFGPKIKDGSRLVSLVAPRTVKIATTLSNLDNESFALWFKDVLVDDQGHAHLPETGIALDVWETPEKLVGAGLEWRFYPANDPNNLAFRLGRHCLPFFGLWLEPLRLVELNITGDQFTSATLACRLSLTLDGGGRRPVDNIIRLTITRTGVSFVEADLCFPLEVAGLLPGQTSASQANPEIRRAVEITAQLAPAAKFKLTSPSLTIRIAETPVSLPDATITLKRITDASGRLDQLMFAATAALPANTSGQAVLTLTAVAFTIGSTLTAAGPASERATFTKFDLALVICPANSATPFLESNTVLKLFGKATGALTSQTWREEDGVFFTSLATTSDFAGIPASVSLGLVARLTTTKLAGTALLMAGHCEGEIQQTVESTTIGAIELCRGRLAFTAAARRRPTAATPDGWTGTVHVWAAVTAKSAITWPHVDSDGTATIPVPLPGKRKERITGRVPIKLVDDSTATHRITWTFAEHHLSLALAADLTNPDTGALWATPVTARHTLTRRTRTLSWSSIEPVAIGSTAAILPPFDEEYTQTTFAPHYRDKIVNGEYRDPIPGMKRKGEGALSTVLQGALGEAFRKAFWATKPEPSDLMLAGGFLGVLRCKDKDTAGPLLHLPVLVGIGTPIAQSALPAGLELAWTDGPAARMLAITRPGAPTPANVTLDAIVAAMMAGSLPFEPLASGQEFADPVAALLVEQSFVHQNLVNGAKLATTPFFIASAVTVTRVLDSLASKPDEVVQIQAEALALVAGKLPRRGTSESVPLAAAFLLTDLKSLDARRPAAARLVLLGDDVTVDPWLGPIPGDVSETLLPQITGLAIARHPVPRVAMIVQVTADPVVLVPWVAGVPPRFWAFPLRNTSLPRLPDEDQADDKANDEPPTFPDHGRGPPAAPFVTAAVPGWLYPVVEGPTGPIRDDAASGIAGLARRLGLAAEALPEDVPPKPDRPRLQLVWLSQTRIPLYLSLRINGLAGPPVGWLTPAPAHVRLPTDDAIRAAIAGPELRYVQPFVPGDIDTAAVGERAGVLTVRRVRSLTALPLTILAYDPAVSRFGSPAQAGSSFARTLRTPRPGPLPPNTGDQTRDRRVQASVVDSTRACSAFIGSADLVESSADAATRWAIAVVAAPALESTITDRWDGSIRLVCALAVAGDQPPKAPEKFLADVLLPTASGSNTTLNARALLRIGDTTIAYRRLTIESRTRDNDPGGGWTHEADRKTHRAHVHILLDPSEAIVTAPQPALDAIATAFTGVNRLPPVEIQWTVFPTHSPATWWTPQATSRLLTVASAKPSLTASRPGDARPPRTLKLPLYPVTAERGALPLTPITLLFGDPAYDQGLASAPLEHGDRIVVPNHTTQPGRGALRIVLAVDRPRVHVRGVITLMVDIRYEKAMTDLDQLRAETNHKVSPGGDHVPSADDPAAAVLGIKLQPRTGPERTLKLTADAKAIETTLRWSTIYELPLAALREHDGSPAALAAGDMLTLEARVMKNTVTLWNPVAMVDDAPELANFPRDIDRAVRLILTDDPVIEPPPALYAALVRMAKPKSAFNPLSMRVFAPLQAQSPLPHSVDLVDPLRDFRRGMLRRRARFVWTLLRPRADLDASRNFGVAILKWDRNGQTHIPHSDEFIIPQLLATKGQNPAPAPHL